jgi:hypothetical protein
MSGVRRVRPCAEGIRPRLRHYPTNKEIYVLWLIVGIVLLIIAIAGGAIIHPILFVIAILALIAFFMQSRSRTVR